MTHFTFPAIILEEINVVEVGNVNSKTLSLTHPKLPRRGLWFSAIWQRHLAMSFVVTAGDTDASMPPDTLRRMGRPLPHSKSPSQNVNGAKTKKPWPAQGRGGKAAMRESPPSGCHHGDRNHQAEVAPGL